ncbi:MAG: type II secretion system secretin GspD [Polyangiaceae bacterium]|nr:type II secretion system secretin GspD [Polyangiaceae bacterium]
MLSSRLARFALAGVSLGLLSLVSVDASAQIRAQRRPTATPARPPAGPPAPPTTPGAPAADDPPGAAAPPPRFSMDAIAKAVETEYRPKGMGHLVKFNLQDADLAELVNHISGMTGRRFIYGAKVRQIKATVVSPTPVTLAEAYEAFLSILEANGMTVVPHGRFLKIVDSGGISTQPTPIYSRGAPVPGTAGFVTRLYRLQHVSADEVAQLLMKFKSKEGDISTFSAGQLLIITDTGANVRRMIRLIEEVDVGGAGTKMWIEPVHYGSAADMAKQIGEIFELSGQGGAGGSSGGLGKVTADDQTNSLVIVGTEDAYLRVLEFMKRVDVAPAAEGKIHVLPLQHAVADELAATLTQMLGGTSAAAARPGTGGARTAPAMAPGAAGEGSFEGEVRVTADAPTNSLIITSSARDYAQLRMVIQKLDMPRRQVFIEAAIMDISVSRGTQLGINYHGGTTFTARDNDDSVLFGGLNPINSVLLTPDQLQGFAVGVRGPELDGTSNLLGTGISIPAFGVVLNAIATSGDTNVLATPHIIATDNTPAEINIGENIPLQTNIGGLGNLGALAGASGFGGLGALGGLGGFGGFSTPRQDVGTKIKITPHINDSDQVRLEIEAEDSSPGAAAGDLGAVSITRRNANTTLVVRDQETVVIGGLMKDSEQTSKTKIPVLGDLPVLGFLFRRSETSLRKSNLLLVLTPHIIHDSRDLRAIFQRKMQERQEFLDRYFVFGSSSWSPPRDWTRTNGLVEDIRQSYLEAEERRQLEEQLERPKERPEHEPSPPIDMPQVVKSGGGAGASPTPATPRRPTTPRRPQQRTPQRQGGGGSSQLDAPSAPGSAAPRINPMARSVAVDRTE